jgi:HK97 family phage major capsid protein
MKKILTSKHFVLSAMCLVALILMYFMPTAGIGMMALVAGGTVPDRQKQLTELRSQLTQAETDMQAIFDKATEEKRSRTEEERTKWQTLRKKADDLTAEIKDLEDQVARDRAAAQRAGNVNPVTFDTPGADPLGKMEVRNVRKAQVRNFFLAADPKSGRKLDGVERELNQVAHEEFRGKIFKTADTEAQHRMPNAEGISIPSVAMRYMAWTEEQYHQQAREQRDIQATASGLGIELINTDTLANNYVQALRTQNVLMNAGVRVIQNDTGNNVVFPRESSLYTAAMASTENAAASESLTSSAFVTPALTYAPKRGTGFAQLSNQLLMQAPWFEPLLREQIIMGNSTLYDVQGINGSGSSGQAKGILNTSGVQTVTGGTNGANFARTHITQFEALVGGAGANLNNCKFITNFSVNKTGKTTEFSTGSGRYLVDWAPQWLWSNQDTGKGAQTIFDQYPAFLSNNVPSNLTKGTSTTVCSAIIFGDVSKMVYMNFGGMQIIVDPYVNSQTALTNYVVHFWFDFNVILPGAVGIANDILTP